MPARAERVARRPGIADNAGVRFPTPLRHRLVLALFAAGLIGFAPASIAQDAANRSFSAAASARVKDAAASALDSAQNLASAALDLIGIRYKWGGNTPETGLDCSGLVRYVFQQVTGVTLPRTAKDMSRVGESVALADLRPGDLVFFNTRRFAFSHVGIYLGDNRFVHAPRRGREVEVADARLGVLAKTFQRRAPHGRGVARAPSADRRRSGSRTADGATDGSRAARCGSVPGRTAPLTGARSPSPGFSPAIPSRRRCAGARRAAGRWRASPSRARWRRWRCAD